MGIFEDEDIFVEFLRTAKPGCIENLAKPIITQVEYLTEAMDMDSNKIENKRRAMIFSVQFFQKTKLARDKSDFVRKCTVENITELAGGSNEIVKLVRVMDLSQTVAREIILTIHQVCQLKLS